MTAVIKAPSKTPKNLFFVSTDVYKRQQKSHVRITGVTVGKIVDYGLKDSQNMGACMAPAAADTILTNLKDFGRSPTSYDRIITGDLGYIGQSILLDFMSKNGHQMRDRHLDLSLIHILKEELHQALTYLFSRKAGKAMYCLGSLYLTGMIKAITEEAG